MGDEWGRMRQFLQMVVGENARLKLRLNQLETDNRAIRSEHGKLVRQMGPWYQNLTDQKGVLQARINSESTFHPRPGPSHDLVGTTLNTTQPATSPFGKPPWSDVRAYEPSTWDDSDDE